MQKNNTRRYIKLRFSVGCYSVRRPYSDVCVSVKLADNNKIMKLAILVRRDRVEEIIESNPNHAINQVSIRVIVESKRTVLRPL